ncbi:MAG TPA: PKD-like domain-containing protein, partial [Methylococcales bacterium]
MTLTANPNNLPGTTFNWTRNNTGNPIGMPANGSGSPIVGTLTLTNGTLVAQTTTFTITTTVNGCTSPSTTASVTVNPLATVTGGGNATYCDGAAAPAINFGSNIAGSTYAWTSSIDVGFGTSGTGNIPAYTASNATAAPVTATVSVTAILNGCTGPVRTFTITVNPTPDASITANYCAVPGFIQLTANPATGCTYLWNTAQTINPILVNVAAQYSVVVTNTYGCSATAILPVAIELVTNGNFSAGHVGFTSAYGYVPPAPNCLWPEGLFTVDWNPNFDHTNFWGRDHTARVLNPAPVNTGNLLIINGSGSNPPIVVWQEVLTVLPNTPYYFSAWAMSMNSVPPYAQLRFNVNGTQVGTTAILPPRPQNNNP